MHSSIFGHLGSFDILVIEIIAALNIGVNRNTFQINVLNKCQKVVTLDHMRVLFLLFRKIYILTYKEADPEDVVIKW